MRIISILALFAAAAGVFWLRSQHAGEGASAPRADRSAAEPQILIASEYDERRPSFSPDGQEILFEREIAGQSDLFLRNAATGAELRLTDTEQSEARASLHPSGRYIAFESDEFAIEIRKFENDRLSGDARRILPARFPAWLGDKGLLHAGGISEYGEKYGVLEDEYPGIDETMTAPASEIVRRELFTSPYRTAWPSASADGRYVAFFSRDGTRGRSDDIYLHDRLTRETRRLTDHPANDFTPAIAPDGAYVVYASNRLGSGRSKLFAIMADGACETQISFGPGNHVEPNFSPDGRRIAFSMRKGGDYDIAGIAAPGPDFCDAEGPAAAD
ncbi:MAG: hypothetical protein Tsb0010_02280 [Parvularculaceae bacterium]